MSAPFGFKVQYHSADPWDEESKPGWSVSLPHQCDAWDVAGSEYEPMPGVEAVAELERFIVEAQEALIALRAGKPFRAGAE